jgi:hypothetical protein
LPDQVLVGVKSAGQVKPTLSPPLNRQMVLPRLVYKKMVDMGTGPMVNKHCFCSGWVCLGTLRSGSALEYATQKKRIGPLVCQRGQWLL